MDPFTQRMLERAKSRREKLDNQKMILEQRSPLQQKGGGNENAVLNDNKFDDSLENKKGKEYITAVRKSKLQKLAQFYSSNNESSFLENEVLDEEENIPSHSERKSKCKLGRLNELASKIKQWEEDVNHSNQYRLSFEPGSKVINSECHKGMTSSKQPIVWDSSMVEKLCSQGFSRSVSQNKLLYDFESQKEKLKDVKNCTKKLNNKNPQPVIALSEKVTPKKEDFVSNCQEVLKKAAFFESVVRVSPTKLTKDPAQMSLAERRALFERNISEVVMPQNLIFSERKLPKKFEDLGRKEVLMNNYNASTSKHEELKEKNDCETKLHQRENRILEKGMTSRLNMGNQDIPEPPPIPVDHQNERISSNYKKDEEEQVEMNRPKSGRLYPSLSNLDIASETEISCSSLSSFDESKNSNLCLNMTLSDLLELNKNNPTTPPSDRSFSQSKECQVLDKMDKFLENALNDLSSSETEDPEDTVPSPPKMKKSSSFEYKNAYENEKSLLHTVSFYRKQKQNWCIATENLKEADVKLDEKKENTDESILVQDKIQGLITEINKQQTILSQASQALNLCLSTVEFSGSGEQVEGERLLLLASHKRQACLNEIQRLKVENTLWPRGENNFLTERGEVNLSNISIKLKRETLRSIAAAENLQYFVCLIKCDEQVLATPTSSATKENLKDMALQFPGQIKLENLLSNFKITVEVYNLELSKEFLPHDVKYHILNKKEKKLLTPIKNKKSESKLVKPNLQSPAGPNAVRTTHFKLCGYIVFSLKEITRTQWILNKVPYVSPVEGTIYMTIQSQLRLNDEFRGFLTMFDDISGFGAWHRRWCLLSSHFISYWKYPDDETKKVPIGSIDLRSVITENVGLVSRDICARLNTFLLEATRPRLSDDKNSLVVSVKDNITTIRHLLSADSKAEMTTWCQKLNTTLALLRNWKCNTNE